MSYINRRITGNVEIRDIREATQATGSSVNSLVADAIARKEINRWNLYKPVPVLNDYTGNSMRGMRLGNSYNLRNDATGDSRTMPGYIGNVVNTQGTNGKGFITVCGLKLPYFPASSGETTGLSECCSIMQSIISSQTSADTYNWPYEWTSGWYRFADFQGYSPDAVFPFTYTAPESTDDGQSFSVSIGNSNITSEYDLGTAELAQALQGWKFGVILERVPVSATAQKSYTLVEGPALNSSYASVTVPDTLVDGTTYTHINVFCVLCGNLLSEPKVIPLPYGNTTLSTPTKVVRINDIPVTDMLTYFRAGVEGFGYDQTTIGKTVDITENGSLSGGRCPCTNDRMLLEVTLTNISESEKTINHQLIGWEIVNESDGTVDFHRPSEYLIYDASGNSVGISQNFNVAAGQSLKLYYRFDDTWPGTFQDGNTLTMLRFGIAWIDSSYTGGYLTHSNNGMFVNSPSSSADSGKVGTYEYNEQAQGIIVVSRTNY